MPVSPDRRTKGSLLVVGSGIQWAAHTTPVARRAIEQADRVFFAVADPCTARWVRELNADAESLPYPRDAGRRMDTYVEMTERVLDAVRAGQRVCAVFYGHPGVLATPVHEVIRKAREQGFEARMLPGISALACLFADLDVDPGADGCHIYEATDFLVRGRAFDRYTPLVLCQIALIGNPGFFDSSARARIRGGLAVLAEVLCRRLPDSHEVVLYEAAVWPIDRYRAKRIALADLADAEVSEATTLYIPPVERAPSDAALQTRLAALADSSAKHPHVSTTPAPRAAGASQKALPEKERSES